MTSAAGGWVEALEPGAPEIVAAWRGIARGSFLEVRRAVRRQAGEGTAPLIAERLGTLARALTAFLEAAPDDVLGRPGGEADWTVAQAIGHDCEARVGLCLAASLAAT
ncbi:MAG: hypothetical protein H0U58_09085, partial [Chloroflexi bacterium]|nr:hypothetical protein [Chloroflexota bacterium]